MAGTKMNSTLLWILGGLAVGYAATSGGGGGRRQPAGPVPATDYPDAGDYTPSSSSSSSGGGSPHSSSPATTFPEAQIMGREPITVANLRGYLESVVDRDGIRNFQTMLEYCRNRLRVQVSGCATVIADGIVGNCTTSTYNAVRAGMGAGGMTPVDRISSLYRGLTASATGNTVEDYSLPAGYPTWDRERQQNYWASSGHSGTAPMAGYPTTPRMSGPMAMAGLIAGGHVSMAGDPPSYGYGMPLDAWIAPQVAPPTTYVRARRRNPNDCGCGE